MPDTTEQLLTIITLNINTKENVQAKYLIFKIFTYVFVQKF